MRHAGTGEATEHQLKVNSMAIELHGVDLDDTNAVITALMAARYTAGEVMRFMDDAITAARIRSRNHAAITRG